MKHQKIEAAFTDDRGTIADVFYKTNIEHVGVIESARKGVIRGNHYHKQTTQHTFVTKGSMRYYWQPVDKSEPVQFVVLRENELATSGPNEVHAMVMLEPCQIIVFSSGLRGGSDYEADTFRDMPI